MLSARLSWYATWAWEKPLRQVLLLTRKHLKNMPAKGPLNPKYKYLEIPHRMRPIWMDGEAESKMLDP